MSITVIETSSKVKALARLIKEVSESSLTNVEGITCSSRYSNVQRASHGENRIREYVDDNWVMEALGRKLFSNETANKVSSFLVLIRIPLSSMLYIMYPAITN